MALIATTGHALEIVPIGTVYPSSHSHAFLGADCGRVMAEDSDSRYLAVLK